MILMYVSFLSLFYAGALGRVTIKNRGAYVLKVSQEQRYGGGLSESIGMGQTEMVDVSIDGDVRLQAMLGRHIMCQPVHLCDRTITCTGTTLIAFDCDCVVKRVYR